jgi:hypothetical protein
MEDLDALRSAGRHRDHDPVLDIGGVQRREGSQLLDVLDGAEALA